MDARVKKIIAVLDSLYPNPKPFLNFRTPFELVVAAILSAQCTDNRVNIVTKKFFKVANTPEKFLKLGKKKIEQYIRSTGFYRAKTKNLVAMSKMLIEKFHGKIPNTMEELQTLPGVGRKTAGVVLAQAFRIPAFPVDRHIFRVANRIGLAHQKNPEKTDLELRKNIPEKYWIQLHFQLVSHGRTICRPKPKCEICPILPVCEEGQKRKKAGLLNQAA